MANPPVRRPKQRRAMESGRKKEFSYRGHTLQELQAMPIEEVVQLLPARMRRTIKRGMRDDHEHLLKRVGKTAEAGTALRTHLRDMPILPQFVGRTFQVHNGKEFTRVDVQPEMIGHYLGEFALTRRSVKHTGPGVGATRGSKFMPLK
ncbi:MAG: 30S ribosomal protein S19 [Halobacteriales archaeon]|nr:30S ribosomal protein S19 [Halobacteriales archaeon]